LARPARRARAVPARQLTWINRTKWRRDSALTEAVFPAGNCPAPGRRPKAAFGVAARSASPSLGPAPSRPVSAPIRKAGAK
jgi:hypothetical protein